MPKLIKLKKITDTAKDTNFNGEIEFLDGKITINSKTINNTEIKQPGTYSKRLLGLLSNLSQKEANIFNKIAKYVLRNNDNSFIISDDEILKNFDIKLPYMW